MDSPVRVLPAWLDDFHQQLARQNAGPVELRESDIFWTLLTRDLAFRIRKPVALPFLDYRDAARRRRCCEEEFRINRRFAADLYLDVVPIQGSEEWALKMRRFEDGKRLDRMCRRGDLLPSHLSRLARDLAGLQAEAQRVTLSSSLGLPETLLTDLQHAFLRLGAGLPEQAAIIEHLRRWAQAAADELQARLLGRRMEGWVREGHGNLHLGRLVSLDDKVVPFNALINDEPRRWIDVAAEVALTYVDLLRCARPDLAGWYLNEWLAESGDYDAMTVMRLYAVQRAALRANQALLARRQPEAIVWLTLCERLINPPPARLIITSGPCGSGKTTASRTLILQNREASLIRLRSAVERRRYARTPQARAMLDADSEAGKGLVYACLSNRAGQLLSSGWSVIVDASFLDRRRRAVFQALADLHGAAFSILACSAPEDELRQRLVQTHGAAADAALAVLKQQLAKMETLAPHEQRCTARSVAAVPH